ncbi:MAG TPA: hypothetical protein VLF59_01735 [Candidatus Saccharimonadales bacterium]|nr:hypothetical protein [Candidatus Saccharimonadales bacterium]
MSRLPDPGSDENVWGELLNDYLLVSHQRDGTLKDTAVGVELATIRTLHPNDGDILQRRNGAWASSDLAGLKTSLGLNQVNNTADAAKPVSVAQQAVLDTKIQKSDLVYNPRDYGAKGDTIRLAGVSSISSSAVVVAASASFTAADVGKVALVCTDTAAGTITTIQSVGSATQVTLAVASGLTASGANAYLVYGTDDTTALQAALTAASGGHTVTTGIGPNSPMGLGFSDVFLPNGVGVQGGYIITSQLTVPSGVRFDSQALVFNMLSDRFAPCLVFLPYTRIGHLRVDALQAAGVQLGSAAGAQAHIQAGSITIWHGGSATESSGQLRSQDCVALLGYSFLIDYVWCKGGVRTLYHNAGSDCTINRAHCIGALTAVHMVQSNQVFYGIILADSCGKVGGGTNGVIIDNQCTNIEVNVMAFMIVGSTQKLDNVVALGPTSTNLNKLLTIRVQAALTGGAVLSLANSQDLSYFVAASNNTAPSFGGSNIVTAVVFGSNVTGYTSGEARMTGSVTPYTGNVPGPLTYIRTGVRYYVQGGAAPSIGELAANGIGAPAGTVTGNDSRGKLQFGSGASPTSGTQVSVVFASSTAYVAAPYVVLTPLNAATAALQPYVSVSATTGFSVGFVIAPSASQANGTYALNYRIES